MQGYEEIFALRGKSYHEAMKLQPEARVEEFESCVGSMKNEKGYAILDLPAGGGYLQRFLSRHIEYLAYDFAGEFDDGHSGITKCKESKIGLADTSVDETVTLAALHHVVNRSDFYHEVKRILKPNGHFLIADVVINTPIDEFLNGFVNEWNSMGHNGVFLDLEKDSRSVSEIGFISKHFIKEFKWNFHSVEMMLNFFKKLFFLDKNPGDEILIKAIEKLGLDYNDKTVSVNWSLGFISAIKE